MSRVRAGECSRCGASIERVLVGLGSTKCQDCRDGIRRTDAAPDATGSLHHEWALMEVDAFLRVWTLRHPEAQAHLLA